ncbi:MAG TPA: 6-phosphogluconolactonase [Pyrinomonadaceae bacterium]|nr:6-phosphogluconolactonase [Pyrinomonadaceae bacterium]
MELKIFESPAEVARAAAEHWLNLNPKSVALSGGSTPRALYQLLADPNEPFREQVAWDQTHFFFTDERHVPPDHPDSNYRMVDEAMFSRVPVPQQNIHRIPAENPVAEDAAKVYESDLRKFFGEAIPAFDLIFLGIGEEGHTASLFPHSPALNETERLVAAPFVEKLNTYRITMTLPVLNNGKSVVFLVTGASKSKIVREVIETARKPDLYPAQAISPTNGAVSWFMDKAAARLCSTSNSSNTAAESDLLNKNP